MSDFPARAAGGFPSIERVATERVAVGERAARVLVGELARRQGPTKGLLVGADPGSLVLAAAVESLLPGDLLTVVPRPGADLRAHIATLRDWTAERVRVVDSLAEADPADVLVIAEPLAGTAADARATLG